jgi:hypothetical protein
MGLLLEPREFSARTVPLPCYIRGRFENVLLILAEFRASHVAHYSSPVGFHVLKAPNRASRVADCKWRASHEIAAWEWRRQGRGRRARQTFLDRVASPSYS